MSISARKIYLSCNEEPARLWADFMTAHRDQIKEALRQEGVLRETWYMGRDTEGLFLIGVMDTDDMAKSLTVSQASMREVDRIHREFKKHWASSTDLTSDHAGFDFAGYALLWDATVKK